MLKILQARLQQYMNQMYWKLQQSFQMFKLVLEKTEEPEFKLPMSVGFRKDRGIREQIDNTFWIIEKAREFRKTSILLY